MDDKIKEVMGLVAQWGAASHICGEAELDAHSQDATKIDIDCAELCRYKERAAWKAIESKLREMVPVWLPIDSAPKDTEILVTGSKRIGTCVAHNDSRDGWETETSSEWVSIYTPTHWMPLPKEPV